MSGYPSVEALAALEELYALGSDGCDDWFLKHRGAVERELSNAGLIAWSRNREGYAVTHEGRDVLRGDP